MDRDFVRALAGLCEQRDWLLLVDRCRPASGRTAPSSPSSSTASRPDAVSFAKNIIRRPAHGRLHPMNEKCRPVLGPAATRLHLWGQPSAPQPPWQCWTFWTRRPLNRVGGRGLSAGTHRGNGQSNAWVPPGPGPHDRGGGHAPRWSKRGLAARLAGHGLLVLTAGPALRLLPPLTITKGEMDRGLAPSGRGLGDQGCARHFCMR